MATGAGEGKEAKRAGAPPRAVVLFDIDGTLVTGPDDRPSAGVLAMSRACELLAGRPAPLSGADYAGRTDPQIARLLLLGVGEDDPPAERVAAFVAAYVEFLAEEIGRAPYRALGAPRLAVRALGERGALSGLGTGNVPRGGRLKLESAGIADLFDFERGGFGDDGPTRDAVLLRGARRIDPTGRLPVIIVGDTPRDIEAAHAMGARCIGVPYRRNDATTLAAAGADALTAAVDLALADVVDGLLAGDAG